MYVFSRSLIFFFKIFFFFKFFQENHQCQTVWTQIRPDMFVGPDLGPNCLQRLSTDNTGQHRVIISMVLGKVNISNISDILGKNTHMYTQKSSD